MLEEQATCFPLLIAAWIAGIPMPANSAPIVIPTSSSTMEKPLGYWFRIYFMPCGLILHPTTTLFNATFRIYAGEAVPAALPTLG